MRYLVGIIAIQALLGISIILHADEGGCKQCQLQGNDQAQLKNYEYYDDYLKEQEENSLDQYDQEDAVRKAFAPTLKRIHSQQRW